MTNLENFDKTIIKIAKSYKIKPLDWEDLAQELRLHLVEKERWAEKNKIKINNYDNWAYISCMNKVRNLAKYYKRQKRNSSKDLSLEELMEKGFDRAQ